MPAAFCHDAVVAGEGSGSVQGRRLLIRPQVPTLRFLSRSIRGCVDHELFVHRQVQGDVEGADECIAAIGITAEIGFRHSGYQV